VAEGRRLLRGAGFRVSKRRVFEANTLFDAARGALSRTGRLLRVREAGRLGILTYKGAAAIGKYKDREELEVEVSDPRRLSEMLARLDFVPTFRYEKFRTEYRRPGEAGSAMLDETPIGVYLELEGAPAWIDRNARRLGFADSDYSTASYGGLYGEYCRQHGLRVTHMTFVAHALVRAASPLMATPASQPKKVSPRVGTGHVKNG
jgi:adenylate cyclase class 2